MHILKKFQKHSLKIEIVGTYPNPNCSLRGQTVLRGSKSPQNLASSLSYDACMKKIHTIRFLMLLLSSKNIHFIHIVIFLDSLVNGLQEWSILKQVLSLEIGLECIIGSLQETWSHHFVGTFAQYLWFIGSTLKLD